MKKIVVIIVVALAMFSTIGVYAESDCVLVKKGTNVTVYTIEYYSNETSSVFSSAVMENPSVAALKNLDVPQSAWAMCAGSNDGIYDSRLEKLNEQYKAELDRANRMTEELIQSENRGDNWKLGFWWITAFGVIVTITLIVRTIRGRRGH